MPSVITPENFDSILEEIKNSKEKLFDFSGTNIDALGHERIAQLFLALSHLPQSFTLKLNDCIISVEHTDPKMISTLQLGLATTKQMENIEMRRAISSIEVLLALAESLTRNHAIKNIHLDGHKATPDSAVKVIPSEVRDALCRHPTAIHIFIDGLKVQQGDSYKVSYASFYFADAKNSKKMPETDMKEIEPDGKRRKLSGG